MITMKNLNAWIPLASLCAGLLFCSARAETEGSGWAYLQGSVGNNLRVEVGLGIAAAHGDWGSLGVEANVGATPFPAGLDHFGLAGVYRKAFGNRFTLGLDAGYDLSNADPLRGRTRVGVSASYSLGLVSVRAGYQRSGSEDRLSLGLEVVAQPRPENPTVVEDFISW